jgi:hypothetical protein
MGWNSVHRQALALNGRTAVQNMQDNAFMFSPSQADVRRFFCSVFAKQRQGQPMEAIETLAAQWMAEHPEHHADLQ